ncbi:Retrovirus-related Pol poly from transposon [Paramuricea clavata]|uniref:Retrovirus-related Pol poly from transposon n=1 Tax=Paramuricea clavata TaxID=317549 RepID=A0A7D9M093_PARCT|nr:Retrovirus-related Pol poly from transposon [Paramuricea clavata]
MANYSSKYIRDFATLTAPLRDLTKKDVRFEWTQTHQTAFEKLKNTLAIAPCMSYFDKNKQTFVTVDASPVGISGIFSQKPRNGDVDSQQIIAYASRGLTDREKRYSQTEKEALAIIIYKSGASNPADYLSRHPTNESRRKQEKMTEQYINFITQNSVRKAMTLQEIINATNADAALTALHDAIKTNKWDSPIVKPFKAVKNELTSTTHGVILRGTRIVIPATLQQRAIDIAHETHLGIEKTKSLIREKIWFPQIDNQVKNTIAKCTTCQAVGQANPPQPLRMTEMPELPWRTVHIDFYDPLPSSEYLLVAVDRYSRFPEVEIVHSTRASTVIPKLDKMFSVHGIPKEKHKKK